ncbi:uncharacterized protein [Nicotiana tomentosiformis]|uniref:uncharacterized protein n=1 Tax=Nicotiana tomentosiformis TaxID=4098 RepID=UPI00388C964A
MSGIPRVRCGALTKDKGQKLGEKLLAMGAWRSSGDASYMWSMTANYSREAAREVLGVSKGFSGGHKGEWWWNEEVQGRVKAKKATYLKLVESIDEGQKSANREEYKKARKKRSWRLLRLRPRRLVVYMKKLGIKAGTRSYTC